MRLWSVHPQYLDTKGLLAVWREGLLARAVLTGATKGYKHHPQLKRFQAFVHKQVTPLMLLDCYLSRIVDEAQRRAYNFAVTKIVYQPKCRHGAFTVNKGQLLYEWEHLLLKLAVRDPARYLKQQRLSKKSVAAHPCLWVILGPIEDFEKLK